MIDLKLNIDGISDFINREEIESFKNEIDLHFNKIREKTGRGKEFLGWVDLPEKTSKDFLDQLTEQAERVIANSDVIVVAGIGGSYLGARAVIEALKSHFKSNHLSFKQPEVVYAGYNLSQDYHSELMEWLEDKSYSVIVISKSGTTTETAIAFRFLKEQLENKFGKKEAKNRIVAITDANKGALRKLAGEEGYTTFTIPDDVGGRYSVFTPVGLFPIAAAGYDIHRLIEGAYNMQKTLMNTDDFFKNPAFLYATLRNVLYNKGKVVEIMAHYLPNLFYLTEWWKQLFGESEGKENKGIFPVGANFTTDLHSMGQYIQEGKRLMFETVLSVDKTRKNLKIPKDPDDFDGLNYLAGKELEQVNSMAEKGTTLAHIDGDVPVIKFSIPQLDEKTLGELLYFFQMSCALSGYILDVNPFDQPGVEAYKTNMFGLLGKPGFEERMKELKSREKKSPKL